MNEHEKAIVSSPPPDTASDIPLGMIRASTLVGFMDLVYSLGKDPYTMAEQCGIGVEEANNTDAILRFDTVSALIALAEEETEKEDFAIRLAEKQDLMVLGQLAIASLSYETVGKAVEKILQFLPYYNSNIDIHVHEDAAQGHLRMEFHMRHIPPNARQIYELTLGLANNCLKTLAGENFHPIEVWLSDPSPIPQKRYWRLFNAPVKKEQACNALIFPKTVFSQPINRQDPAQKDKVSHYIVNIVGTSAPQGFSYRVEQVIRRFLPTPYCDIKRIARELGESPIELENKLTLENSSFDSILDHVRISRVDDYLASDDVPLREVAALLGFQNEEELAIACLEWFECSPLNRRHQLVKEKPKPGGSKGG